MGNELLSQVGNVSRTATTTAPQTQAINTGFNTGNLFSMPKDYSNDYMMPDCLKTGNITDEQRASIFGSVYTPSTKTAQAQQPQNAQNRQQKNTFDPNFNGEQVKQPQLTQEQINEYYEKLLSENPNLRITEKGNLYEVSHTGKKVGILTGIGIALFGGIKKLCTGTELKNAFNLKSLAIKLPILAVTGWAVGSLIDAFANSLKAQQADVQAQNV